MNETGKLTVGSLFSGIGGFDLGLERTGCFETKWFCEVDPYCRRVLAKHWPGVPIYGDVRALGDDILPAVDVLCGGFPCQDISLAGRGAGLSGARSGLWSEYARLVRELRPRYVIVENVPALRKRGLEVVLADLLACGYDAEWDGIPAAAVGAPHRRDRLWILAYPITEALADPDSQRELQQGGAECSFGRRPRHGRRQGGISEELADASGVGQREPHDQADPVAAGRDTRMVAGGRRAGLDRRDTRPGVADPDRQPAVGSSVARRQSHPWTTEPDVGRVAHGVPARVDRLRGLGNALVPQIAEWIGNRIAEHEGLI